MKRAGLSLTKMVCGAMLTILCIACSSPPTTYYVSVSGNDQHPGTLDKPLKSIGKVSSLNLNAGDNVLFKGGETFRGTLSLDLAGTPDLPITIGSYSDGVATIDGNAREAIILKGRYFKLERVRARGVGRKGGNSTNGISMLQASHATVQNCRAEGFQKSGLDLYDCTDVLISDVSAVNNGFGGITVNGSDKQRSKDIRIQDSHAENNAGDPTALDNHSGNGILVGMSQGVVIDHCTATNNGWDMPRTGNGPVGIWAYECDQVTIQYCISYRNKTQKGAKDGGGFDLDGGVTNSVIQYCLSFENEGAGYGLFQYAGASSWHNNVVRYCLSVDDATTTEGSGGIFVWNGTGDSTQLANCVVHNNLVYSTQAPAVQFEPSSLNKNFLFANNIFIGTGDVVHGPSSGERFIGNVWWAAAERVQFRGSRTLAAWARSSGQEMLGGEMVGRQVDPLVRGPITFVTDPYQLSSLSGYSLEAGSSLKNSGVDMYTIFNIAKPPHDFFGTPLPQGQRPEPGIFEWPEAQ